MDIRKIIVYSTFIGILLISLGFNSYFIYRGFVANRENKEIVETNINPIIETVHEKNEEINKENDEFIENLKETYEKNDVFIPVIEKNEEKKYVSIYVDGECYETELASNLEDSQKQTIFFADQLNKVQSQYESDMRIRNEMVSNLVKELESAKKQIQNDFTEKEINKELNNLRKDFFKFGLDGYFITRTPLLKDYSVGIGANFLFINKFNIRINGGISFDSNNYKPEFGASFCYYF